MQRNATLLLGMLFLFSCSVHAGVVIGGTRIIYPADQNEVQVTLKNKDSNERYLVQSWVSQIDDSKAPFVITPPIYKLEESRQALLHVVYTGDGQALPKDRESLFMANVKSVSAMPANLKDKNTLQFAVKTRIKLFWRPESLNNNDAITAWEKINFRRQGDKLIASNPTPFYISFAKLKVGDVDVQPPSDATGTSALTMMVAPFSEQFFSLPKGKSNSVSWSAISDYGAETNLHKQSL